MLKMMAMRWSGYDDEDNADAGDGDAGGDDGDYYDDEDNGEADDDERGRW